MTFDLTSIFHFWSNSCQNSHPIHDMIQDLGPVIYKIFPISTKMTCSDLITTTVDLILLCSEACCAILDVRFWSFGVFFKANLLYITKVIHFQKFWPVLALSLLLFKWWLVHDGVSLCVLFASKPDKKDRM